MQYPNKYSKRFNGQLLESLLAQKLNSVHKTTVFIIYKDILVIDTDYTCNITQRLNDFLRCFQRRRHTKYHNVIAGQTKSICTSVQEFLDGIAL